MDPRTRILEHLDPHATVELARAALRIPSLSGEEKAAAEFFADRMRALGLEVELQAVPQEGQMPGPSYNAIGRLRGSGGGVSLLFNGHLDHNPVCEGWTRDPFGGIVEDGWLYGFVHMKAANAAYLGAVAAAVRAGLPLRGDVVVATVCGELMGGAGTRHALRSGLRADCFVVGEPSELELGLRHGAAFLYRIHVRGRMKHYSTVETPGQRGVHAVEQMVKLLQALGPSHRRLPPRADGGWLTFDRHPGFEPLPQLNVGSIRGGISREYNASRPALFPDWCTIMLDVRAVPGMTVASVRDDLDRLLSRLAADDPDFSYEIDVPAQGFTETFAVDPRAAVVRAARDAHRLVTGRSASENRSLLTAASDASWLAHAGIPGVVYGPAGKYLSRPDEHVQIHDVLTAAKVYAVMIADLCSRSRLEPQPDTA
jgi:acetylornithine deacetylase